ncbi:MAG: hypothetical protein HDR88_14715 [Bacteroides sp.]|nr:hypothetical protein [Bacteroides sp.]
MKKVILSFALLTASALPLLAQTDNSTATNSQDAKKEQLAKMAKSVHRMANAGPDKAFEGIELTDEQKTKLNAISFANHSSADVKKGKDLKKEKDGEKQEKMTPEQMRQLREERVAKQQEDRKTYLMQIKEILTPDQYIIFLENSYTLQDNGGRTPMMNKGGMGMNKKGDVKGLHRMKDPRGNKTETE